MASVPQTATLKPLRPVKYHRQSAAGWLTWMVIPSWLVSLAFHITLLVLAAYSIYRPVGFGSRHGRDGFDGIIAEQWGAAPGFAGGGTGQPAGVGEGVDLGPGDNRSRDRAANAAADGKADAPASAERQVTASGQELDEAPPVNLDLPSAPTVPKSGRGFASASNSRGDARDLIRATGSLSSRGSGGSSGSDGGGDDGQPGGGGTGGSGGGAGGTGGGGTSFFGHKASGTRFVYVLDASGSMYDYNAIAVAKAELLSSLEQLDATQQFQIIFYNEKCHPMVGPEGKEQLFWGTDTNRTLASQFIRNIQPDGGTRHLDALLKALTYTPEVIFFLTDAGEPILYPGDLEKIKQRNHGRSRIFSIEFGKGANLKVDNYLKKLARDNGGAHAYRDVQEFRKK